MAVTGTRFKTIATVSDGGRTTRTKITIPREVLPADWFEVQAATDWNFLLRDETQTLRDECGLNEDCRLTAAAASNLRVRLISGTRWIEMPWWGSSDATVARHSNSFVIFNPNDAAVQQGVRDFQKYLQSNDIEEVLALAWRPGYFAREEIAVTPNVAWAIRVIGRDDRPADREEEAWAWWSGVGLLPLGGVTYRGSLGVVDIEPYSAELGSPVDRFAINVAASFRPLRRALLREVNEDLVEVKWLRQVDETQWAEISGLRFVGRIGASTIIDGVFRAELEAIQLGEQLEYGAWTNEDQQRRHPRDEAFTATRLNLGDWGSTTAAPDSTDRNPGPLPELPPFPVPEIVRPDSPPPKGVGPSLVEQIPRQSLGSANALTLDLSGYFDGDQLVYDAYSHDPQAATVSLSGYHDLTITRADNDADFAEITVRVTNRWGSVSVNFSVSMDSFIRELTLRAVPNFVIQSGATESAITVGWGAPLSVGGALGTTGALELEYKKNADDEWTSVFTDGAFASGSRQITGLESGTAYDFRIRVVALRAGSVIGRGAYTVIEGSTVAAVVPNPRLVRALPNQTVVAPGGGRRTAPRLWLGTYFFGPPGTVITGRRVSGSANVTFNVVPYGQTTYVDISFATATADYSAVIELTATNTIGATASGRLTASYDYQALPAPMPEEPDEPTRPTPPTPPPPLPSYPPIAASGRIPQQTVNAFNGVSLDVARYFTNNIGASYSVSSASSAVSVRSSGSTIRLLRGNVANAATVAITVTASVRGRSATQTFNARIGRRHYISGTLQPTNRRGGLRFVSTFPAVSWISSHDFTVGAGFPAGSSEGYIFVANTGGRLFNTGSLLVNFRVGSGIMFFGDDGSKTDWERNPTSTGYRYDGQLLSGSLSSLSRGRGSTSFGSAYIYEF